VLIYKWVAVTQGWAQPNVGLFRTLLIIYLVPFLGAVGVLVHSTWLRYLDINRNPYYMKFSQMAILGVLNFVSIMCDYTAIVSYAQMQKVALLSMRGLEFRLPFYLLMKLTLTPILTHFFGMWILNRFFVFKVVFKYFLLQVLGIIIYEFTVWDRNSGSSSLYSVSASVLGGFRLIFPSIYTMNFSGATNAEPYIFQWLPHFFMLFTSLCNALIPVLTKSFLI
jgi:hypothetical protein